MSMLLGVLDALCPEAPGEEGSAGDEAVEAADESGRQLRHRLLLPPALGLPSGGEVEPPKRPGLGPAKHM